MSACGSHQLAHLLLGVLLGAQMAAHPARAADEGGGYEGWAFAPTDSALARDPLAGYRQRAGFGRDRTAAGGMDRPQGLQLSRTLDNGMALDAGMARGREWVSDEAPGLSGRDYRDAFLGFRYQGFSGRVWYLEQAGAGERDHSFYYQAGWKAPVGDRLSLSLQMGSSYRRGVGFDREYPDLSISAEGEFGGYGLGIRLIDRTGLGLSDQDEGYSLMGSFRKRFP